MSFLIPCDDIIIDIDEKYKTLHLNPDKVSIGYRGTQWVNNAPVKVTTFNNFKDLLKADDNITIDNIAYIKYIDIYLWHKSNKIDRMNGSGDTVQTQTWDKIKDRYSKYLKVDKPNADDEEKKSDNAAPKANRIIINIDQNPPPLQGQRQSHSNHRYSYYRWYNDPVPDMVENGYYEASDKSSNGQKSKIKIEKHLKKSYKKTKLYDEAKTFKFLTATVLDSVHRNHENMEVNIVNDTSLNLIYRLHANKDNKPFKKLCVLNAYGEQNGFLRHSTLSHSLSKHNFNKWSDRSDEASKCLYTSTMVYSPNCIIFRDMNEEMTANYLKCSFITAYPVDLAEYYRVKKRIFNAPALEQRLNALDDKLNSNGIKKKKKKKKKHVNNNKSDKQRQAENAEFIAKLKEMEDVIDCIMRERIRRMIEIAIYNGCDAVIFDAFGCNAGYGNDVKKIADVFAELMRSVYFNCFKSVNFAVPEVGGYGIRGYGSPNKKNAELMKYKVRMFQEAFQQQIA